MTEVEATTYQQKIFSWNYIQRRKCILEDLVDIYHQKLALIIHRSLDDYWNVNYWSSKLLEFPKIHFDHLKIEYKNSLNLRTSTGWNSKTLLILS